MAGSLANFALINPKSLNGVGTYTYTLTTAGLHYYSVRLTVQPSSTASIILQVNGAQVASASVPSGSLQSHLECLLYGMTNNVGDIVTLILSSSTPAELATNGLIGQFLIHTNPGQ